MYTKRCTYSLFFLYMHPSLVAIATFDIGVDFITNYTLKMTLNDIVQVAVALTVLLL